MKASVVVLSQRLRFWEQRFTDRQAFWILVDYRYPSPVLSLDQQHQP